MFATTSPNQAEIRLPDSRVERDDFIMCVSDEEEIELLLNDRAESRDDPRLR